MGPFFLRASLRERSVRVSLWNISSSSRVLSSSLGPSQLHGHIHASVLRFSQIESTIVTDDAGLVVRRLFNWVTRNSSSTKGSPLPCSPKASNSAPSLECARALCLHDGECCPTRLARMLHVGRRLFQVSRAPFSWPSTELTIAIVSMNFSRLLHLLCASVRFELHVTAISRHVLQDTNSDTVESALLLVQISIICKFLPGRSSYTRLWCWFATTSSHDLQHHPQYFALGTTSVLSIVLAWGVHTSCPLRSLSSCWTDFFLREVRLDLLQWRSCCGAMEIIQVHLIEHIQLAVYEELLCCVTTAPRGFLPWSSPSVFQRVFQIIQLLSQSQKHGGRILQCSFLSEPISRWLHVTLVFLVHLNQNSATSLNRKLFRLIVRGEKIDSTNYTKLKQTWKWNIGKKVILILFFLRFFRSLNPNDDSHNKRINVLIRLKEMRHVCVES